MRAAKKPQRPLRRSRLRMIVLVPKLRLSGAKMQHDWLPTPSPRVRGANSYGRAGWRMRRTALLRRCGKQGLTPKLSRIAARSRAHSKLFLLCGWRSDAVSA